MERMNTILTMVSGAGVAPAKFDQVKISELDMAKEKVEEKEKAENIQIEYVQNTLEDVLLLDESISKNPLSICLS
jgi:hypothetical protein